jgi:hypothetical protein
MAGPPKKKQVREVKNSEEIAFSAAANSVYNVCIPMADAEFIRFKHPYAASDIHTSTKSPKFFETFKEFSDKGLFDKLCMELTIFGGTIDHRWLDVLDKAKQYCAEQNGLLSEAD